MQVRQLGQCLPGGEAGAGERAAVSSLGASGTGIRARAGTRVWRARLPAVAQVGVIGDPGAGAQVGDVAPACRKGAHAIDAGHMAWLPVGMTLFDEFPVHQLKAMIRLATDLVPGPGVGVCRVRMRRSGSPGRASTEAWGMVHGDS